MQTRSKPLQQMSWLQFDSAMLLFRIKPGPIREALRLHLVEVAALDEAADEAGATIEAARKGLHVIRAGLTLAQSALGLVE